MSQTVLDEITAYLHAQLDSIDGMTVELHEALVVLAQNYARGIHRGLNNHSLRLAVAIPELRSELAAEPILLNSGLPQHLINRATAAIERVVLLLLGNVQ